MFYNKINCLFYVTNMSHAIPLGEKRNNPVFILVLAFGTLHTGKILVLCKVEKAEQFIFFTFCFFSQHKQLGEYPEPRTV